MSGEQVSVQPDWNRFREDVPAAQKWAYFDHACVSPLTRAAAEGITTWLSEASADGGSVWSGWAKKVEHVRQLVARMIGAETGEIALVPNTTSGITIVAEGLDWKPGDNAVTLANEFPSNLYPWLNLADRGVETRQVAVGNGEVDVNRIADACDARTRIIALSWVGYSSGFRLKLQQMATLAHDQGALLLVDAIQGLGVFPLDVNLTGVDFVAADGHKWMMGPEGAGILYIRRRNLDQLRTLNAGWNSVVHAHDFSNTTMELRPSAMRYEGGSQNMCGFAGLAGSLETLFHYGLGSRESAIACRILSLTDLACRELQELGAKIHSVRDIEHASGIVSFDLPHTVPSTVRRRCLAAHVNISCRSGRLRISPHAYINEEDVERLVDVLRASRDDHTA